MSDVTAKIVDRSRVEVPNGRFLDRPHHALGLADGPWVVGFGQPMLDAILGADWPKNLADKPARGALVVLNEWDAVVSQDGVDPVRHRFDGSLAKGGGHEFGHLSADPGEYDLRRSIDHDK